MRLKIKRYHPHFEPPLIVMEYEVEKKETLLEALQDIKKKDRSLTFSFMCRSGICGSCAVRVNGKEVLACAYEPKDGDLVEPLSQMKVVRDLVVDMRLAFDTLKRAKAFMLLPQTKKINEDAIKLIEKESDCILCTSCYSSCPVYETNASFLGPFALARSYRYVADSKEEAKKEHIDAIVENGIWDCTLCGNCTQVCPQNIDPKRDILNLQSYATQFGYQNPNLANFGSFGLDF